MANGLVFIERSSGNGESECDEAMATRDDGGKTVSGDGTTMESGVRGEDGTVAAGTTTVVMALWRLRGNDSDK